MAHLDWSLFSLLLIHSAQVFRGHFILLYLKKFFFPGGVLCTECCAEGINVNTHWQNRLVLLPVPMTPRTLL